MDLFSILNLEKTPLPAALIIYLVITTIILKVKPTFIFGDEDYETSKKNDKTIWLFFLLLAIFVYTVVSVFVSNKIRDNYCSKIKTGNIKELINLTQCTNKKKSQ